jgi:hypothetical protein
LSRSEGFKYVPYAPQTFDVTIRPQNADSEQTIITSGSILLDLDSDRRIERIGASGEADFKQIPWKFKGTKVIARPQVDGYEEVPHEVLLSGAVVTLLLHKLPPPVTVLRGSIVLPSGKHGSVKILVEGENGEISPDPFGRFEMKVNGSPGDRIRVKLFVGGKLVYDDFQTLPGPITLAPRLTR